MTILFACHRLPFPPNRGGKIRPFNMLQHLGRTHRVVVASLAESEAEMQAGERLRDHCHEVIAEVLPPPVRWRQAGLALLSPTPSSVAYFSSASLARRVLQAAARFTFDAVVVHCAFAAHYADGVAAPRRLLDFGDLDSGKWREYARVRRFPASLGYALEARKLRAYERALTRRFDRFTVTTAGERAEFQTLGTDRPCTVIPNGVDGRYFSSAEMDQERPPVVVFLGRMDYYPNIDGVLAFVRDTWPLVRARRPQAELRIIGSNPSPPIAALGRAPGITVSGHVPDVRPFLKDAAVSIAPLRLARGTQNKILESMALGIPVVATAAAAKGIQATPGRHLLVGDTAREFAAHVIDLLADPARRAALAAAARQQVVDAHHWSRSLQLLDEVLGPEHLDQPRPLLPFVADTAGDAHAGGKARPTAESDTPTLP